MGRSPVNPPIAPEDDEIITIGDFENMMGGMGAGPTGGGSPPVRPVPGTTGVGSTLPVPGNIKDLAALMNLGNMPVAVEAQIVQRRKAPPGYVLVTRRDPQTGQDATIAVLEPVAVKLGLKRRRAKPPISATQWKHMKSAARGKAKAKKIAQDAGFVVRASKR